MTDTYVKDSNNKEFKLYDVARNDYPELEGKIIEYNSSCSPDMKEAITNCLVVGCNTSVGITIVNAANKDDYFVCITGEVAPGGSNITDWDQDVWEYLVNAIDAGRVDAYELGKYRSPEESIMANLFGNGGPTGGMCAYGQ